MIEIVKNISEATCITHGGNMHADDVFATAFLELYLKSIKVYRVDFYDENEIPKDAIVYDVGFGKFDHHQPEPKLRDNQIPYCSFGLLWNEYGREFLKNQQLTKEQLELVFESFDKNLVEAIDADDNGVFPEINAPYKVKTVSDIIKLFNPSYGSNKIPKDGAEILLDQRLILNAQFLKAVNVASAILQEELKHIIGKVKASEKVLKSLESAKNHILFLEEYMPYLDVLLKNDTNKEIYFVIFPSNRVGYTIKTVANSKEDSTHRVSFPKEWGGLINQELEEVSGITDALFCHNKLFIATAKTKEAAYEMAKRSIDYKNNQQEQEIL